MWVYISSILARWVYIDVYINVYIVGGVVSISKIAVSISKISVSILKMAVCISKMAVSIFHLYYVYITSILVLRCRSRTLPLPPNHDI